VQRDDCHVITYIHNYIIDLANERHFHGDVSGNHPSVESHPLSPGCHLEEEVVERTRIDFIAVSTNACTWFDIHMRKKRTWRSVFMRTQTELWIRIGGWSGRKETSFWDSQSRKRWLITAKPQLNWFVEIFNIRRNKLLFLLCSIF